MQALIQKAQAGLIRKRFNTSEELVTALYTALVEYLDSEDLIRLNLLMQHPVQRHHWTILTPSRCVGLSEQHVGQGNFR